MGGLNKYRFPFSKISLNSSLILFNVDNHFIFFLFIYILYIIKLLNTYFAKTYRNILVLVSKYVKSY